MKYIAVLITVYNRKETTLRCLRDLKRQEMPDGYTIEVYMTNDGCTDGTREAVVEQFPEVNIIDGDGSLYWNHGMIAAWEEAVRHRDYDFYLWLNDDTILLDGAIKRLLECSALQGDKVLLVGSMTDTKGNNTLTYGGRNKKGELIAPGDNQVKPCVLTNGNLLLVPRCVYNVVGMNDKAYTHSRGDYDYGWRAVESGLNVFIAPGIYGMCDRHDKKEDCFDISKSLKERWTYFVSSQGFDVRASYHFSKVHKSRFRAVCSFCKLSLFVIFPTLKKQL